MSVQGCARLSYLLFMTFLHLPPVPGPFYPLFFSFFLFLSPRQSLQPAQLINSSTSHPLTDSWQSHAESAAAFDDWRGLSQISSFLRRPRDADYYSAALHRFYCGFRQTSSLRVSQNATSGSSQEQEYGWVKQQRPSFRETPSYGNTLGPAVDAPIHFAHVQYQISISEV